MTERKLRAVPAATAIDDALDLGRWEKNWDENRERAIAEQRAKEKEAAERAAAAEHRDAMIEAGFKLRSIEAAECADESKPAIAAVRDWNITRANVLVISGPAGVGKTVAAAYWALHRKRVPRFLTAAMFARSSRYNEDERREWLAANALVLDDLGAEYADAKGSFRVDLDELIDTYYGNRRPLLITTNLLAADFKRAYGERITDRLREAGDWIGIAGESLRRKP